MKANKIPSRADLPPELVERKQWMNSVRGKVPCDRTGREVDAHDPANWRSFGQVRATARRSNGRLGVGFVLTEHDPFCFQDYDGCRLNGTVHPEAWKYIEQFVDSTYTEWSQSGHGAHVMTLDQMNRSACKNEHAPWGGKFELYDKVRFVRFTGDRLDGSPAVLGSFPSLVAEIEGALLPNGSGPGNGLGTRPVEGVAASDRPRHDVLRDTAASMAVKGVPDAAILAGVVAVGRELGLAKDRGERTFLTECRSVVASARNKFEAEYDRDLRKARNRRQITRALDAEEAQLVLPEPPDVTLGEELAQPLADEAYAIDELVIEDGNVLIPAMRKAGKTTLLTCNLARCLVDGVNFLDRFEVRQVEGSVVVLSYEMTRESSLRWMDAAGVVNQDNLVFWHLRGQALPFWLPAVRDHVAAWLRSVECEALIIEPAGRAAVGLVRNHNDRAQVDAFTTAVDALKLAGGVRECYMSIHMGWSSMTADDDEAHALGSEAWEAWADAVWPYMKDKDGTRMLRGFGRDVEVEAFSLKWERATHRLTAGETRAEHRQMAGMRSVCEAMLMLPDECTSTELRDEMHNVEKDQRSVVIKAAEDYGYIERWKDGNAKRCRITQLGRQLVSPVVKREQRDE